MKKFVTRSITAAASGPVEPDTVTELCLYIENDGRLYQQMIVPTIKNMQRKIKSGKYNAAQAVKAWQYVADEGVRRYGKEFGDGGNSVAWVNKNTRIAIAEELMEYYDDLVQDPDSISSSTTLRRRSRVVSSTRRNQRAVRAASIIHDGLDEFKPWSGAVDTWNNLIQFGKLNELEAYLDDVYYNSERGEGLLSETELNDLLWFEPETIYEAVGLYYDPDSNTLSDDEDY